MDPLPASAAGLVVGATDPGATATFLSVFGLVEVGRRDVPPAEASALHGLGGSTREVELATPGAGAPRVWVVGCDDLGSAPAGFQRGPRALDIYTSSMDDALDHLRFVGIAAGPVGTLAVGPVRMRQCLVAGPDGTVVVLVESSHRRSSLLDGEGLDGEGLDGEVPLFSEGHSVVWCVESMDAEAELLASAGLTKGMDLSFEEPEVSTYLGLPRSPVPIRMTMLSGAAVEPLRLELLEFPDDPGAGDAAPRLHGGLWALRFTGGDPSDGAVALESAGCTRTGSCGAGEAVVTPGGVRLQLVV